MPSHRRFPPPWSALEQFLVSVRLLLVKHRLPTLAWRSAGALTCPQAGSTKCRNRELD
jgi:hypothetical protein